MKQILIQNLCDQLTYKFDDLLLSFVVETGVDAVAGLNVFCGFSLTIGPTIFLFVSLST